MNEAVLVLDEMPENCEACILCCHAIYGTPADKPSNRICNRLNRFCESDYSEKRPDWCPIKTLPSIPKLTVDDDKYTRSFAAGMKIVIDSISGGDKENRKMSSEQLSRLIEYQKQMMDNIETQLYEEEE